MELNITKLVNEIDPSDFYASQAELGPDAARIAWWNALNHVQENSILTTDEQRQEVLDYFQSFGAWDEDEIAAWDHQELEALLLQEISSDLRQAERFGGLGTAEWEKACENRQISGSLYKGDDGDVYFYVGF